MHLLLASVIFDLLISEELDLEAGGLQLFGGPLFFQEKLLDSVMHLIQLEVAVPTDFPGLVKGQLRQKLSIVFALAWGYNATLAEGSIRGYL